MSHTIRGEGDPNTFSCVHAQGDGKLYRYGISTRFPRETRITLQNCLIDLLKERANPEVLPYGIHGLQVIRDASGTEANYQSTDGMFADDILCEIAELITEVKDDEIIDTAINNIAEQMKDMIVTNGFCPSGRCVRLFQIYMTLRDYKDGVK